MTKEEFKHELSVILGSPVMDKATLLNSFNRANKMGFDLRMVQRVMLVVLEYIMHEEEESLTIKEKIEDNIENVEVTNLPVPDPIVSEQERKIENEDNTVTQS